MLFYRVNVGRITPDHSGCFEYQLSAEGSPFHASLQLVRKYNYADLPEAISFVDKSHKSGYLRQKMVKWLFRKDSRQYFEHLPFEQAIQLKVHKGAEKWTKDS